MAPESELTRRAPAWDGFFVIVATDPDRDPAMFGALTSAVSASPGGVLVVMQHPVAWPGGPVVGVSLRRDDGAMSAQCWLGPLVGEVEQDPLLAWLQRGGPGRSPLPVEVRHRVLRLRPAAPLLQTTN